MKKITAAIAATLALVALSGCSAKEPVETTRYNTAAEVAAAYTEAGGNCSKPTDYTTLPGNTALLCGDGTIISKLTDENAKDMHENATKVDFPNGYSLIAGENWSVFGAFSGGAQEIADAIGGELLVG